MTGEKIILLFFAFFIGTVIGSFLNVVICRLPKEQSIVTPPSHCPSCSTQLTWWQLIPLISYIAQKRRCSHCDSLISPQYFLVELITGFLFAGIYFYYGITWLTLVYWLLTASLVAISVIDWQHYIIPNELTGFVFLLGLSASLFGVTISIKDALLGSLLGGGILLAMAILSRGGMGGGDIKLVFGLGLFTGWQLVILFLFIASVFGSIYGLGNVLIQGREKGRKIPFGPFLALAGIIVLIQGQKLFSYYWSLF